MNEFDDIFIFPFDNDIDFNIQLIILFSTLNPIFFINQLCKLYLISNFIFIFLFQTYSYSQNYTQSIKYQVYLQIERELTYKLQYMIHLNIKSIKISQIAIDQPLFNILETSNQMFTIDYNLNLFMIEDVSSNQIMVDAKQKALKDNKSLISLGINAINQLQLKVDVNRKDDVQQLSTILVQLLTYPNSDLAQIHADAMRLGNYDLEKPNKNRNDTSSSLLDENSAPKICACCGFMKQAATIDIQTSFDQIKNMGVSTYLYFSNYKKLSLLLLIMTVVYSAYSLITNVMASSNGALVNSQSKVDYIAISLSSKQTNDNSTNRRYYFIQCWLGVANIIVWIFALAVMKFNELKSIEEYDNDTISCSDYSVVIEGIPVDVTKNQLQKQLDAFYAGLRDAKRIPVKWDKPFKIAKLNIGKPFYLSQQSLKDSESEQINKQLQEIKQKLIQLVLQRRDNAQFKTPKNERSSLYERYKQLVKKKMDKLIEITNKIKKSLKEQTHDEITTVFVTFQSNINKTYLAQLHQPSVLGRIQSICGKTLDKFWYQKDGKNYKLSIKRAPQPEDIIWTNLGQNNCNTYLRKFFTFSVTILLLGICFGIVYGLSIAQENAGGSRPISIAISLTISIINIMLGQVIRNLTVFEKDYTQTYRQASLAIKSVLAQMINTILIPIVTAYYAKNQNFYYANGLVDNIFMLSISSIIVPPIMLLINPYRIFMAIVRCVKSRPKNKLSQTQKQHNILQEGVQFEVGYQSIYSVSVFMFVCFYVSLQPIISVVAMLGYFLMYWVQKYSLFNRYRRPVPGMEFVNNAVYKMISFGPVVYSFGSLTWANFSPTGIPPEALVPNLIALGLSVILFIIPFNTIIIGTCMSDSAEKPTLFQDDRIFMPSQYDRLNPDTQTEGFQDYKSYMERRKEQIKKMNPEQQAQFNNKMFINAQRGQMINQARPQAQNFNFFQPQPMFGYGQMPMMGPSFPQMGFMPGNYMGNNIYNSGIQNMFMPPAPVMSGPPLIPQPAPSIINIPPNRPQQIHPQNQMPPQNYQPQPNHMNNFAPNPPMNPPPNIFNPYSNQVQNQNFNPFTANQPYPPINMQPGSYGQANPNPGNQFGRRW